MWQDPRVVDWLAAHAVVAIIDPEKDAEARRVLSLTGVPEVLACKGDREFDRLVGLRYPSELLAWFDGLEHGTRSILASGSGYWRAPEPPDAALVVHPLSFARQQLAGGVISEAARSYAAAWTAFQSLDPSMTTDRSRAIFCEIESFLATPPSDHGPFHQLRDLYSKRLAADKVDPRDVIGWAALNRLLGNEMAVLDWVERARHDRRQSLLLSDIRLQLLSLLTRKGWWSVLIPKEPTPSEVLLRESDLESELYGRINSHHPARAHDARLDRALFLEIGVIYAALLASDRECDAEDFARQACDTMRTPSIRLILVEWALRAGEPRDIHIQWLSNESSDDSILLRLDVERSLHQAIGAH